MNKAETLALWEQGPEAWNGWAREMLKQREDGNDDWQVTATADFRDHSFVQAALFRE